MKKRFRTFKGNANRLISNRNGFGIKEIAISLGAVVVVGIIVVAIGGISDTIVSDIWRMVQEFIKDHITG
ncbi:MAG: hypothetical protein GX992_09825 [Clostridium sp.]|nr:hypothetical protein [Clostridium sp.]